MAEASPTGLGGKATGLFCGVFVGELFGVFLVFFFGGGGSYFFKLKGQT